MVLGTIPPLMRDGGDRRGQKIASLNLYADVWKGG